MLCRNFIAGLLFLPAGLWAQPDPAAGLWQDLELRESRALQKIDEEEAQERIKLRTRERDELARIQREVAIGAGATSPASAASAAVTGSRAAADTARLIDCTFAQDELQNLIQNQLGAGLAIRLQHERNTIRRQYRLERAKLDAASPGAATPRDRAVHIAELNAQYQAQLDELTLEEETEAAQVRFSLTTKINLAERDLAALSARLMMTHINQGTASAYNPAADPEIVRLSAVRDQAKNALTTALDELRARFRARRTGIESARDHELASVAGS